MLTILQDISGNYLADIAFAVTLYIFKKLVIDNKINWLKKSIGFEIGSVRGFELLKKSIL